MISEKARLDARIRARILARQYEMKQREPDLRPICEAFNRDYPVGSLLRLNRDAVARGLPETVRVAAPGAYIVWGLILVQVEDIANVLHRWIDFAASAAIAGDGMSKGGPSA